MITNPQEARKKLKRFAAMRAHSMERTAEMQGVEDELLRGGSRGRTKKRLGHEYAGSLRAAEDEKKDAQAEEQLRGLVEQVVVLSDSDAMRTGTGVTRAGDGSDTSGGGDASLTIEARVRAAGESLGPADEPLPGARNVFVRDSAKQQKRNKKRNKRKQNNEKDKDASNTTPTEGIAYPVLGSQTSDLRSTSAPHLHPVPQEPAARTENRSRSSSSSSSVHSSGSDSNIDASSTPSHAVEEGG